MPIYLCQPGISTSEPWRYGIQVYERPFPLNNNNHNNNDSQKSSGDDDRPSSTHQLQMGGGEKKKKDGPEQIIVMISNNDNDNDSYTEKFAALQRYLTEFASSPQDRVLVFCNNSHQKAHNIAKELDNANFKAVSLGDNDAIDVPEELGEFLSGEEVGGKGFNILVVDDSEGKFIFGGGGGATLDLLLLLFWDPTSHTRLLLFVLIIPVSYRKTHCQKNNHRSGFYNYNGN